MSEVDRWKEEIVGLVEKLHKAERDAGLDADSTLKSLDAVAVAEIVKRDGDLNEMKRRLSQSSEDVKRLEAALLTKESALERISGDVAELSSQSKEIDTENKRLLREARQVRDENDELKRMQAARCPEGASGTATGRSSDEVLRLENLVSLRDREISSLKAEQKTLERLLRTKESQLAKLDGDLQAAKKLEYDTKQLTNEMRKLAIDMNRLQEENRTLADIQRAKNKAIECLTKQLGEKLKLEEDFQSVRKEKESVEDELRAARTSLEDLRRTNVRKDAQMLRVVSEVEATDSSSAAFESEKRVLQTEVKRHIAAKQQMEKTLKAEQQRVEQLTGRLEAITAALRDAKLSGKTLGCLSTAAALLPPSVGDRDLSEKGDEAAHEKVDLTLYEVLQHEVEALKRSVHEKEELICDKDSALESLSRNLEIQTSARGSSERKAKREMAEAQSEMSRVRSDLEKQLEESKTRENDVKRENMKLKAKTSKGATTTTTAVDAPSENASSV